MKSKLVDMMMSFFICTACITILEGIIGRIFPQLTFGYRAFFSPPFLVFCLYFSAL